MTILALAVVQQSLVAEQVNQQSESNDGANDINTTDQVRFFTSAIAPFLIPMIESIGNLPDEVEAFSDSAGEAA